MEIDLEKDTAVREWMKGEGWPRTERAVFEPDPQTGFWVWREERFGEPSPTLAIHESLVRYSAPQELTAILRVVGVADALRRHSRVRLWEGGRLTGYGRKDPP